ncbi:MAG: sulfatase-like hydrolase/transferase [Candidatus Aminicenantales bacterium]
MPVRKRDALSKVIPMLALGLYWSLSAIPGGAASARGRSTRLNVLLITIDTLRADRVGAYGSSRLLTPNLDALAARSAVFTRAFAHTPVTLPSHANILLGTTPSFHGVHDNLNFVVREEFVTLAEHLGSRGYATGAFVGGFPLASFFGLDQGFSVYDDFFGKQETGVRGADVKSGERVAGEVWTGARKWLRGRTAPWFLWVHFYDPHDPYDPPEPYRTRFAQNLYDGEVAYTDAVLGDILKDLKEQSLEETTLVVCVSDHGESLGEHNEATHGYLAYNATIWVPFIVRIPGFAPRLVGQNVSHIDIFPTVCDALGIERPHWLQGVSLLPLMRGKRLPERPVYFESLSAFYNMGWAPLRGLIDKQSKFIDSPRPELYDLRHDFGETNNLAGEGDIGSLRKRLESIVRSQTSPESAKAGQASDRATLEKLRSLGYVASLPGPKRTDFGPEDSVAALLPYHNSAAEALGLYRAGKTAEGISALREVLSARKNISAAYLNLATIYKEEKRPADAIAVLRLGLEAMPENYDIHFQHLAELYESGQFDEVLRAFGAKDFPQVEFDPVVWNCVGLAHWKKGDVPQALDSFERSLAIDDDFAVTYHNLGTVHFDVFQRTRRPESYDLALAHFQKATSLDPTYSPAFHSLGVAYTQAGDFARAIESLEKALDLNPGLDEAHFFLGSAHLRLGHNSLAHEHLTRYKTTPTFGRLSPAAKQKLEELIATCRPGK